MLTKHTSKRLLTVTGLIFASLLLMGNTDCSGTTASQQATKKEQTLAEQNKATFKARCAQSQLISQEVRNLCKRAERINTQNLSSCVTLFTHNGAVAGHFPVNGKVSSLNSYLMPGDQVSYIGTYGTATTESPDIDGAYGKNADGIFFFTADSDAYVEWQGDYFWSDQCLKPVAQPILVMAVTEED